jgi:hypothetical protein
VITDKSGIWHPWNDIVPDNGIIARAMTTGIKSTILDDMHAGILAECTSHNHQTSSNELKD